MPKLPRVSGQEAIRVLERLGFVQVRQRGSHVALRKQTPEAIIGCTVPLSRQLAVGTLSIILRQAQVTPEEFLENLIEVNIHNKLDKHSPRLSKKSKYYLQRRVEYFEGEGWSIISTFAGIGALFAAILTFYKDSIIIKIFTILGLYFSATIVGLVLFFKALAVPLLLYRILFISVAVLFVLCAFSLSFSSPHF